MPMPPDSPTQLEGMYVKRAIWPNETSTDIAAASFCMAALRSGDADVWMTDRETLHAQHLERSAASLPISTCTNA